MCSTSFSCGLRGLCCTEGSSSYNKMLKLLVVSAILGLAFGQDWPTFKSKHNKDYKNKQEEQHRHGNWKNNIAKIDQHNQQYENGQKNYHLEENEFADWSDDELKSRNGANADQAWNNNPDTDTSYQTVDENCLPETVDWVKKGYVTSVKNQGHCGDCWAFSASGSLEGQHYKASGQLVNVSASNIMDCSQSYGTSGCQGGYMSNAFEYVEGNHGVDRLNYYPDVAELQSCRYSAQHIATTCTGYKMVSPTETALKVAVAQKGPISVGINAGMWSFNFYKGGVYDEPSCGPQLDHGVLAVGYGVDNGQDYWLVKNSWGPAWGINGYIMMSRNKGDQCGIASAACYPIVQ